MTDLRVAVTAMLDTDGVHPGDERWQMAYDHVKDTIMEGTVEEALHSGLDFLGVQDNTVRFMATQTFWNTYNGTRRNSRKSLGARVKDNASKLLAGNGDQSTHH